jgi:predicted PurR-regulated permease PerM
MNESALARALYRVAVFTVVLVVLTLIGLQLRWVLLQLFAAAIIAAGIEPIVARLTDPKRYPAKRWRPPTAAVVIGVYVCVGVIALVLGTILLRAVLVQGAALAQQAPAFVATVQGWYLSVVRNLSLLEELDPWNLLGGASALTQWIVGLLRELLNVAGLIVPLFGGAVNVIFVLFIALYMSVDGRSIRDYLLVFLPPDHGARGRRIVAHISSRLGQWIVGQLVVWLVPRVMHDTVKLNPLVVLVAVLVGHELLGVAGALFAIPLAAALAVIVDEFHQERLLAEARNAG